MPMTGYSRDPGFLQKTVRDLGFDCSWETGFADIGHGIRDMDVKRKRDAGFS